MANPTHRFDTSAEIPPTSDPTIAWSHEFEENVGYVAVWDDAVYLVVGESLAKIDQDGNGRWRFSNIGKINTSPAVVDGTVFVGSDDGNVYALDAGNGTQQWTFETGGHVWSSPAVVDGTVFFGSMDKHIYALDAATGNQQWTVEFNKKIKSSLAVVDGTVFLGHTDTHIYALDAATGSQLWAVRPEPIGVGGVRVPPTVVDGTVFIGGSGGDLYAVDATSGDQQWTCEIGLTRGSPAVVDGTVFVVSDGQVHALDANIGTKQWVSEIGRCRNQSPAVVDGTVFVVSDEQPHELGNAGQVHALDANTGRELWTIEAPEAYSSPTVVDGTVYAGGGKLYAITALARAESGGDQRPSEPDKRGEHNSNQQLPEPDDKEQIPAIKDMRSPERRALSFADFQTIEAIGEGGQAVIKKARLTDSKAPPEVVAIRQLPTSSTVAKEAVEQFQTRSEIWETIDARERDKHRWREYEHIVGVIDSGEKPFPWIAMEYMDGGDLAELVEENPDGLPVGQAMWTGECVCKGLEIADNLGRCHLDVKPENVLLKQTDGWPWPKLADWGVARNLVKETGSMNALSPEYAAPEQMDSGKFGDPDQLTDIYQTGALVYALLTGDPPVSESSIWSPSEHRSRLSAEVDAAVELALAQEKTDRYDSIADFRKALNAIRTGERLPREVTKRVEE